MTSAACAYCFALFGLRAVNAARASRTASSSAESAIRFSTALIAVFLPVRRRRGCNERACKARSGKDLALHTAAPEREELKLNLCVMPAKAGIQYTAVAAISALTL